MTSLIEQWAAQIGWSVRRCNVLVEGTSDVDFFLRAAHLYRDATGYDLLEGELSIIASGKRHDGGVDGVNRRLNLARQLAEVDRDANGWIIYSFVGLFDNDRAGRRALRAACDFDRRLIQYKDLFLLNPVMPICAPHDPGVLARATEAANRPFEGLNWEVEDLCSESLLRKFETAYPGAVRSRQTRADRTHRELEGWAKPELKRYVLQNASLGDLKDIVLLIKALRSYFDLKFEHISA